jgi:phage baseplate assembly protein W
MALSPSRNLDAEFLADEVAQSQPTVEPFLTYSFDPLTGELNNYLVDGIEAIRQWVRKAIVTPRNTFLIYDDQYGSDLEDLIAQNLPTELAKVEIQRLITEALIYDDRIASVSNFVVTKESDRVFVDFQVRLSDGLVLQEGVTISV